MSRKDLVVAALASAKGSAFSPVQIQKLLFLIDRRIGRDIGGPYFDFIPYHYGPFDKGIYGIIDSLVKQGVVDVIPVQGLRWKLYKLTPFGQTKGESTLSQFREKYRSYIANLSMYVLRLTFDDLVSVIYRSYPEMEVNSIFKADR